MVGRSRSSKSWHMVVYVKVYYERYDYTWVTAYGTRALFVLQADFGLGFKVYGGSGVGVSGFRVSGLRGLELKLGEL